MLTRTIVTLMTVAAISGGAVSSAQAAPNAAKKFECYHDGNPKHFRPGCPLKEERLVRAIRDYVPPTTPPGSAPLNGPQPFDSRAFFDGIQADGGDGGGAGGGSR